jgi:hypothetical protein
MLSDKEKIKDAFNYNFKEKLEAKVNKETIMLEFN